MDAQSRQQTTLIIWRYFAAIMLFLFASSIFGDAGLGIGHIILGLFVAIAAFVSTGTVWNWGNTSSVAPEQNAAKHKRGRQLDHLLSELDDEELAALRDHLERSQQDGIRLSDDGELVRRR